ncbi:MAG TPA: hypothetical protein VMZ50_00470 [Phycisphaerae bacterium]|nr:hypothetical protein [Phycisphaerae bacterium]
MNGHGTRSCSGITLLEGLLASVVLAAATTTVIWPFVAARQNEQIAARQTLACCLAQELLEEILAKPFEDPDGASDPGPDAGEGSRAAFDNIDDYQGYSEGPGQIVCFDGEGAGDLTAEGLSRSATATYVYVGGQDTTEEPTFILITVQVSYRGDSIVTLKRLAYAVQ